MALAVAAQTSCVACEIGSDGELRSNVEPFEMLTKTGEIDFSIIVPVFNRKSYLEAAIHSISRQTYQSYEVIVIDDGSTDDTAEFVESLGDPISTIRQANSGVSEARNHGARIAQGKYLVFLDSDDVLLPWSLQCYSDVINRFHPLVISARTIEFRGRAAALLRKSTIKSLS